MQSKPNFADYGKSFQENLVQLIYQDRPFADQITEVLDLNFLDLEYLRVFSSKIINYRQRYGSHPSSNAIATILNTELDLINFKNIAANGFFGLHSQKSSGRGI